MFDVTCLGTIPNQFHDISGNLGCGPIRKGRCEPLERSPKEYLNISQNRLYPNSSVSLSESVMRTQLSNGSTPKPRILLGKLPELGKINESVHSSGERL